MRGEVMSRALLILTILFLGFVFVSAVSPDPEKRGLGNNELLDTALFPKKGTTLLIQWNDVGTQLVAAGVIDEEKWRTLYGVNMTPEYEKLLKGSDNRTVVITEKNAGYLLNMLWAFGLANKSRILEKGEMVNPRYGGAGNFASTGGWTLAKGAAMDHYSRHTFVGLTEERQLLVEKVSKDIYRPCCNNSAHFPDCNHGMALLGLLELLASQGASEEEMYRAALAAHSYWFPDTYLTIAQFLEERGVPWNEVTPRELLGAEYSSGAGFSSVASLVKQQRGRGASCSV